MAGAFLVRIPLLQRTNSPRRSTNNCLLGLHLTVMAPLVVPSKTQKVTTILIAIFLGLIAVLLLAYAGASLYSLYKERKEARAAAMRKTLEVEARGSEVVFGETMSSPPISVGFSPEPLCFPPVAYVGPRDRQVTSPIITTEVMRNTSTTESDPDSTVDASNASSVVADSLLKNFTSAGVDC
ncbi:hypothetical protein AX17_002430 [Amanita inopinata Kibby_2008]|nr:hypothetical protein AX17_002430 [Amanita inopinata Kibby_2008]